MKNCVYKNKMNMMKTKILVLLLFIGCVGFIFPITVVAAVNESESSVIVANPSSSIDPSESFLRNNTRTTESVISRSPMSVTTKSVSPLSTSWDELIPGGGWEEGDPGIVGGPLGDATLPVVISILLLYLGFRTVSTSRRKNRF